MSEILPTFIDTHAHLDTFARRGELERVINDSRKAGLSGIVICSDSRKNWELYAKIVSDYPDFAAWQIGIHPTELDENSDIQISSIISFISSLSEENHPVAIGEIGLDFYRDDSFPDRDARRAKQVSAFEKQIEVAKSLSLPICVHARNAVKESIDALMRKKFDMSKVVFHCFSGTVEQLRELNSLGARASWTGIITYKSAEEMRKCMLLQGLEKIMFETDCPYLAPIPKRGTENEPKNVILTAEYASKFFKITTREIAEISSRNARDFFKLRF